MTNPEHLRHPIRHRAALLERHAHLAAEAARVDAEQQRLAVELARLRQELRSVRDSLWPTEEGHVFHKTRRPGSEGIDLVPPPLADATPLRGRSLRDAALLTLLRAERALTLAEIHRALHLDGHVMLATDPVKRLGDALGYEERRGTVRRVARGTYAIGTLTPHRRRQVQRRREP